MSIFTAIDFDSHKNVNFFYDRETNLKAIIAIHNTSRGPAIGGCRIWPYIDEQEAITDVLRLSRAMTYKAAMANLPFGGGKAVIIGDPRKDKSSAFLRAFGKCLNQLNGDYITGEDVGTSVSDMDIISEVTSYVVGTSKGSGDLSPLSALGVYESIRAAVAYRLEKDSLRGLKIAVQGLGHVGYHLCKLLADADVHLSVTDLRSDLVHQAIKEFKAEAVLPEDIYKVDVDVFSPCALGGILNDHTIPQLKCALIVGSANNQLEHDIHGEILANKKILYAPDYVVNAGGIINASYEGPSYDVEIVKEHIRKIPETLLAVFHKAHSLHIPTNKAADLIAEERLKRR